MVTLLRRGSLVLFLAFLVLLSGLGDYRPTSLDLIVAPHKYSLVRWELANFLDKWVNQIGNTLPWNSESSRDQGVALAEEFFFLGLRVRELERKLAADGKADSQSATSNLQVAKLRSELEAAQERRSSIRAVAEETVESEISSVLAKEGLSSRGGFIFPPVDTVFTGSPTVLILSPRDQILRQETILLEPGLADATREGIEDGVLVQDNLAALVENTGGVASYPSVVAQSVGLHDALVITAHEWLHHWFFFRPLGQHFWDSAQMTTLNETAATLGGEAIGDLAFTAMTGRSGIRSHEPTSSLDSQGFDFRAEMQKTRLRTEELLAEGRIRDAEAYMEERRQFLAANGRPIRKINQAYFAFHGSYAVSPASISPIEGELRELRDRSASLEEFIRTVAQFGSYEEFLEYLDG